MTERQKSPHSIKCCAVHTVCREGMEIDADCQPLKEHLRWNAHVYLWSLFLILAPHLCSWSAHMHEAQRKRKRLWETARGKEGTQAQEKRSACVCEDETVDRAGLCQGWYHTFIITEDVPDIDEQNSQFFSVHCECINIKQQAWFYFITHKQRTALSGCDTAVCWKNSTFLCFIKVF